MARKRLIVKVLVLVNAALYADRDPHREHVRRLPQLLSEAGLEATIEAVPAAKLRDRAVAAARESWDALVAGGGDGTVSSVAEALVEQPLPLGVLPLGTFNHFARDVGVPLGLEDAVRTLAAGRERRVDVGEVAGRAFLNNVSIGAYPAMVLDREAQRSILGRQKYWAMLVAGLRVLRRFPLLEVRLASEAAAPWCTTPFVFVGNNRYRFDLLALGTRAALDRGKLSVYAADCATRTAMLRLGLKAAVGQLEQDPSLIALEIEDVWIESRRRQALRVGIDGEIVRLKAPLHFRIRPSSLRVIVPQ